jgi:hypothetical protein
MNERSDLDALVSELNAAPAEPDAAAIDTAAGMRAARTAAAAGCITSSSKAASDLLLVSGAPPSLRVNGAVVPLDTDPLEAMRSPGPSCRRSRRMRGARIRTTALPTPRSGRPILAASDQPASRARAGGRSHSPAAADGAALATLNLPPHVDNLTRLPRGLVLIGGPTGSGKTTTLAALVNEINLREARHIITIEDPIEYEHHHRKSLIEQVEVGVDAPDFPTAAARRVASGARHHRRRRNARSGTMQIAVTAGEDRASRVLEPAHARRAPRPSRAWPIRFRSSARTRFGRAGHGAGGGADADADAAGWRRPHSGSGAC